LYLKKAESKVVQVTSEWLTEEAKQTRETFLVEAVRVAGDRAIGKAFDRPKRVALVSCMGAIFMKSTNKRVFFPIRIFEICLL